MLVTYFLLLLLGTSLAQYGQQIETKEDVEVESEHSDGYGAKKLPLPSDEGAPRPTPEVIFPENTDLPIPMTPKPMPRFEGYKPAAPIIPVPRDTGYEPMPLRPMPKNAAPGYQQKSSDLNTGYGAPKLPTPFDEGGHLPEPTPFKPLKGGFAPVVPMPRDIPTNLKRTSTDTDGYQAKPILPKSRDMNAGYAPTPRLPTSNDAPGYKTLTPETPHDLSVGYAPKLPVSKDQGSYQQKPALETRGGFNEPKVNVLEEKLTLTRPRDSNAGYAPKLPTPNDQGGYQQKLTPDIPHDMNTGYAPILPTPRDEGGYPKPTPQKPRDTPGYGAVRPMPVPHDAGGFHPIPSKPISRDAGGSYQAKPISKDAGAYQANPIPKDAGGYQAKPIPKDEAGYQAKPVPKDEGYNN